MRKVLDLEKAKDAQVKEIAALKKRIHRLERKKMLRPTGLKRLKKVGMSRRVESSEDQESLGAPEDASKQGRSIADLDKDDDMPMEAKVDEKDEQSTKPDDSTAGEAVTTASVALTTIKEITLAQILIQIKAAKPKVVTTAATTTTTTRPKARGVVVQEPSEFRAPQETQPLISKDKGKAMMEADRLLAERLQTREREELTDEEKGKLFMELMEKRRKHFAELRAQEKRNRPPTRAHKRTQMSTYLKHMGGYKHKQLMGKSYDEIQKLFDKEMKRVNTFVAMSSKAQESNEKKEEGSEEKAKGSRKKMLGRKRARKEQQQESSKKQRMEEDKETDEVEEDDEAELKKHLVIKQDDDIAIDAIPLATKPPVIVDYKLLKEGIMVHYQLIRADGSSKRYSSMIRMLQGIDREDLLTLWKLVKTKHGDIRPEDDHERVMWGDFKVMFEPDIRSKVWRDLQGYTVSVWKLYDSCGVHFARFRNVHIFMLVEKRYPLTPITITNMLNKKLQTDHFNEMCYQLLKLMMMNIKFRGGLLGFKRLQGFLEVTTAQVMDIAQKDKKQSKPDKTEHGNGKSTRNRSRSQMHNNIMATGSRDCPPMLVMGRYAQWRSRFLRYIDTRPNGDALLFFLMLLINGVRQLQALVDKKRVIVTESSIRKDLHLDDAEGTDYLPTATIFEELAHMGAKSTAWNEFSSPMVSLIICLATNQKFNLSKYIFDAMVKHLDGGVKFLMYPRFLQVFINQQLGNMLTHKKIFVNPFHSKKVLANIKRAGKDFSGRITPLFDTMMVQTFEEVGKDSDHPTDSTQIPIIDQPSSSSQPKKKQPSKKAQRQEAEVPQDETEHEESVPTPSNDPQPSGEDSMQLTDLMVLCTKLQTQVLDLEKAKDAQAKEIAALKKRIQRLERKKMSRPTGLKRLKKVGMSRRVESSEDQESLGDPEDASKHGRSIADLDKEDDATLVDETQERQDDELMFDTGVLDADEMPVEAKVDEKDEQSTKPDDSTAGEAVTTASVEDSAAPTTIEEITLAQTLIQIKAAKPKVVTTAATTTTTTRPKARGVVVQEPSEFRVPQETQPSSSKDKGKGIMIEPEVPLKRKDQIALDEQIARDIQAKLDAELIEEQKLARKQEEEANIALIESWENTQAMMEADRLLAERLQSKEREELTDEEKGKLFMELMEKRRKHFAALRAQEKRNRPPTKAQKRTQMSTYLKHMGGYTYKQLKGKSFDEI
ncbi:hypothetical protein Tco_0656395 [Tanacetum coccineum]|uniref:Uncharacterized protein n=1 Tax=Tanacetum coccineum TaxID=301880 RepID=A0ABQ4X8W2_9ASTR